MLFQPLRVLDEEGVEFLVDLYVARQPGGAEPLHFLIGGVGSHQPRGP